MKYSIRTLLVVVLLVALATMAYDRSLRRRDTMKCINNLKALSLALENYYSAYECYPSPDAGGHSWRIRLMPFIESGPTFMEYRFDEPWNGPRNSTLDSRPLLGKTGMMSIWGPPHWFSCPHAEPGIASYLMFVGKDSFGKPSGYRKREEITDPLETTIVIAETRSRNIYWLEPIDFDTTSIPITISNDASSLAISSNHPRGPAVVFADGAIYRVSPNIDKVTLRALITINGGENIDRQTLIADGMLLSP